MASHNELGELGEQLAAEFLQRKGYVVLEQNYRYQKAEIDILAQFEDQIIVVEVKTRNSDYFGNPQDFVSQSKIKLLVKAANEYILANDIDLEVRFDIVAVLKNQTVERIQHFENAFYHF